MAISSSPVQQATGSAASALTFNVTLSSAPIAGNALIACIGNGTAGVSVSSITGGGVTWVKAVSKSAQRAAEIWYGLNSAGSGTTITITVTSGSVNAQAAVSEWAGIKGVSPVDTTNTNTGSGGTSINSGSVTPTNTGDLVIGFARTGASATPSSGPTNSYTSLSSPDTQKFLVAYKLPGSLSSTSVGWTYAASTVYDAVIAAFLPAVAGGRLPLLGAG